MADQHLRRQNIGEYMRIRMRRIDAPDPFRQRKLATDLVCNFPRMRKRRYGKE